MANFSALKTAIQNAIKQNGNEEITGDVLQQILLSIVSTMGDGAINTIEQNLSSETLARQRADNTLQSHIDAEAGARQSADGTLQSNIDAEALARGNADTQLQNAINAIKSDIDNGYVYAGIATPTATPVSGKVFYIATAAGTYTNFGGQVLTQGINILRFNGSAWSSQQLIGIDDAPTAGSNSLVKSGGVQNELALGAVYDVSAKNPTGGPNNDGKWESLSALLLDANLNTLIPTAYRKGGMSIKFVHTNDNKYVQARCMAQNFTTDVSQWQCSTSEIKSESKDLAESGAVYAKAGTLYSQEVEISQSGVTIITNTPPIISGHTYYIELSYVEDSDKPNVYLQTVKSNSIKVEDVTNLALKNRDHVVLSWTAQSDAYAWALNTAPCSVDVTIADANSLSEDIAKRQKQISDLRDIRIKSRVFTKLMDGAAGSTINDFSNYDVYDYFVNSTGKWSSGKSILVPVEPQREIVVINSGSSTDPQLAAGSLWFTILTDESMVEHYAAHISSEFEAKYGKRIEVATGKSSDVITTPFDAKYISVAPPSRLGEISIYAQDALRHELNTIESDIQETEKELDGIADNTITDFSGYTNIGMGVLANGNWTTVIDDCILIPREEYTAVQVVNSGSSTNPQIQPGVLWFTCLRDDYHSDGQQAHICQDFIDAYDANRLEVTTGGTSDKIELPSDCAYIAIVVFSRLGSVTLYGTDGIRKKVENLEEAVYIEKPVERITDFSSFKKVGGIIVNGKWLEGGQSTFIPVTGKYLILQNSQIRNSFFSLLKNDNYTVGANVDYCDVDRSGIALGERLSLAIPDDCKFLCVTTQLTSSGVTYNTIPTYVEFPAVLEQSELQKDDGVYSHLYGEQFSQAGNALIGGILEWRDFSFCHITDMHGTFVAAKAANDVRDRYNYFIPILNTGDVVKGEPRLNNVLAKDFTDYMVLAQKYRIFHICGQHEVGFTNLAVGAQYNGKLKSNCLSHQQVIDYYIAPMAAIWGIATPTTPYWYKDFTEEKVRLIGLYQYNSPLTDDPNDSDYYLYERGKCWYGQDQLDWFCNLLKTASADYRIVVMMHEADGEITLVDNAFKRPDRNTAGGGTIINGSPIFDILDAFVSRGTLTRDYYAKDTVTYPTNVFHMSVDEDFSDAVADYGVCLGGDFHTDHIGTFGTNKLLYKGMTASCEQATDCHVDGAAAIPNVSYKDLSCNCVADTCGITFSKNILSLARVGQTGSVFSQDRRFCRVSIKE